MEKTENVRITEKGTRTVLVNILDEMGTDIRKLKMGNDEIFDEIIKRIHLSKLESQRLRSTVKKLNRKMETLVQMSISDLLRRKD